VSVYCSAEMMRMLLLKCHSVTAGRKEVDSLLSGPIGQLLLPFDWLFLPIVRLYSNAINRYAVQYNGD